jgi:wobble nucleotide-excising tRNase
MIQSIDIPNFGSFKDFDWRANLRDAHNNVVLFKRMNILYGRNYSGKTTLSRIIRCLETGELPQRYEHPEFTIATDDGEISVGDLHEALLDVRVYNRDFVAEHLSFLTDENGEITPFAVIGRDNTEIEKQIRTLETQIGTHNPPTGLRKSLAEASSALAKTRAAESSARSSLEGKLTEKANRKPSGIKHDPLFRAPTYNITKIRDDIAVVRESSREPMNEDEKENLRRVLSENRLQDLTWSAQFEPRFAELRERVAGLLSRELRPNKPIEELLETPELQRWVKAGIPLHRATRDTCGFCTAHLTERSWTRLDEHFDEASSALEAEIDSVIKEVDAEASAVSSIPRIDLEAVYGSLRPRAKTARDELGSAVTSYSESLNVLKSALVQRKRDLLNNCDLPRDLVDRTNAVDQAIVQYAEIVDEHNGKSDNLASDQAKASRELRLNEVLKFITDIDLDSEEARIEELARATAEATSRHDTLSGEVAALEPQIANFRLRLKDESEGAAKVNDYLTHYFGHGSLRLENVEVSDGSGSRFKVFRGRTPAYNLSEGECSLVAFCYFIARLEAADSVGKELVIFIDDPISSLDENHIFFIYSLIQSLVACRRRDSSGADVLDGNRKPIFRYRQLFIATHNLDFLKYCKRLDRPKKDCAHFLVLSKADGSHIEEMPAYLRDYVTEFNFLFDEICVCADPANQKNRKHSFYSFGNNLRKFLEAYLFFKYPSAMGERVDHQRRVEQFFKGEVASEPLVQRLVNELSHLEERFDRSVQPLDIPETSKLAAFVLTTIRRQDPAQYKCLLESVGRGDPLAAAD